MPLSGPQDNGNYDLFIEYDATRIGLILHRDTAGNVQWYPSLAPALQPQYQTGEYGYELTPSEVSIPLSYQDFRLGAGYEDDLNASPLAGPRSYSYSRGVDVSEGTRGYPSPLQVAITGIAVAPVKFIETSLGLFCIAGRYIYELSTQPATWTQRADAGVGNAWTDIIEYKSVLFAAMGNGGSYQYSSNGTVWTAYSDATVNALYWATRDDVLWYVDSSSRVANNQAGTAQNGGTAWSATDNVGHSGETVRGMLEIDNELYIFKEEGIYRYTGTATEDVWLGGRFMRRTTNGFKPYLWHDQKTYVPYGDRLLQFDHTVPSLEFVFPTIGMRGHPELNGQIAAICGDTNWLYVAIYNANGDTYIMKGNPYHNSGAGEWHTYIYLGTNQCQALLVAGPDADNPSSNNPALLAGKGAAGVHYILPRVGWRAEDDANFAFDTSPGTLYGSWHGWGAMTYNKFLNGGVAIGRNLSSSETVRLSYEIDQSGVPVSILTATQTGTTRGVIETTVEFARARPVIRLATGASTTAPVFLGAVLDATPNPPRRHQWTFMVDIIDSVEMLGGGQSPYAAARVEAFLFGAAQQRVRLIDKNGREFIVKVNTVAGIGPQGAGGAELGQ